MIRYLAPLWNALPRSLQHGINYLLGHKYVVGTNIILTDDQGRVWLQRHRFWGKRPWGLPGGHVDSGETPQQAIIREIKEELSADIAIRSIIDIQQYGRHGLVVYFAGKLTTPVGLIDATEVLEADYYYPDQLPDGIQSYHRHLIQQYIATGDKQ